MRLISGFSIPTMSAPEHPTDSSRTHGTLQICQSRTASRLLQSANIEFTMKRLREPIAEDQPQHVGKKAKAN
jgi:hypothetical protein